MPIPTWTPGEVLASADVNAWFVDLAVTKGADQSVTSSTAAVNDTALFVPLAANASYFVMCYLLYEGGTLGGSDIQINFATPAGSTAQLTPNGRATSGVAVTWGVIPATAQNLGTNGAGSVLGATVFGTIQNGGTAGNLQLRWAQVTSSATPTIVHKGSSLAATRYA